MKLPRLITSNARQAGTVGAFVVLCVGLSVLTPHFLTTSNLLNVVQQTVINAVIAVCLTFVIISGGSDLSVGSVLALAGVVMAHALHAGYPVPLAVATQAGKGALLESHALGLGGVGVTGTLAANRIALTADVVLCLGTRLSDFTTASKTQFQDPHVRFVAVNVNSADAAKHGALPLVGDARATLAALGRTLRGWRASAVHGRAVAKAKADWEKPWRAMTSPVRRSSDGLLYQSEVIGVLNEFTDARSTVVHGSGGIPGDIHKLWRGKSSTDYHSEYGYSCMGYEIAGALGVKLADSAREVYAFLGDGSYLMLHTEIVTAVQEGRKITVVLNDNHAFGCIHNLQRGQGGGRSFGNEFRHRSRASG